MIRRVLAPNASVFTGRGTNTWVIGDPPIAVLDPGPADPAHVAAILEAAPGLEQIFVTHTHGDHSPAASVLAERTGARVIGRPPPDDGRQDLTFVPDEIPVRDQVYGIGALRLHAIDTPGHASNHVCYLLEGGDDESDGRLFSGDHILDRVTPVILPPDGSMVAYLDSLRRLLDYPLRSIAPGHGRVLTSPKRTIELTIAHRLRREDKVRRALREAGSGTLDDLLPSVYDDVRAELWPLARFSLEAHLIKLAADGEARLDAAVWHAA